MSQLRGEQFARLSAIAEMCSHVRGPQMFAKPIGGQASHFFEGAGFLEQMRGVRHDRERLLALQLRVSMFVQPQDFFIALAHDEEGRRFNMGQSFAGQVRPAATRDDRANR